jgi:prepilin-type N-terminal cleavage/methylation domain-containing protein
MFSLNKKTSGFTLIELVIAMTIFGMMITMVMSIYFSTSNTTRKLNAQRELAETAREITERLTEDIQEK